MKLQHYKEVDEKDEEESVGKTNLAHKITQISFVNTLFISFYALFLVFVNVVVIISKSVMSYEA